LASDIDRLIASGYRSLGSINPAEKPRNSFDIRRNGLAMLNLISESVHRPRQGLVSAGTRPLCNNNRAIFRGLASQSRSKAKSGTIHFIIPDKGGRRADNRSQAPTLRARPTSYDFGDQMIGVE